MRPARWISIVVAGMVWSAPVARSQDATGVPTPPVSGVTAHAALVAKTCLGCHNDKLKTAGLSLQGLSLEDVPSRADVWEKVLRKVQSGDMPPVTARVRPEPAEAAAFAAFLETTLDRGARVKPNPGRAAVHRLNRAEYSNAIRDLLAVDIKPGEWLPVDDSGYGFDNIADVLSTSPALLERYMSAARRVSRLAVGDVTMKPVEELYDARRDPLKGSRNERLSDDLPFDSRAGISVQHYFPLDAEYEFEIRFVGLLPTGDEADTYPYRIRVPVRAGLHAVGVTSPRENGKVESEVPLRGGAAGPLAGRGGAVPAVPYPVDLRLNGERIKRFDFPTGTPEINRVIIGGPFNATGRGTTASRERIFTCRPATPKEEPACARQILATLARRAFRRPVTQADIQPLYAFYERARGTDLTAEPPARTDFDAGIQKAIEALLVAPEFLFRVEQDPARAEPGRAYPVSDIELASRLSFFLWSSLPDDQLLQLAERGRLKNPEVLRQQVRRMLADPRADTLVSNFAGQWLHLRNVEQTKPDPFIFPFDEFLRQAFQRETELLVAAIFREDRSLLELLTADFTFVNERLAEHYGIPKVYGSQFRRVPVTDPNRRGLLGHGSVLTVTSYPNRTSVVMRGKWILENLLGTPPPPPPPDVPELRAERNGKALSMREQMQAHRANPICASCHGRMDPIGFALENYDAVGKWRTEDADTPIDASGQLPDGTRFEGPAGLSQILLTKYREDFVRTATEKLLTYALGRGVEYYDYPTVRAIARNAARDNYRISSWIQAVVTSTPFQMRRAAAADGNAHQGEKRHGHGLATERSRGTGRGGGALRHTN